MMIDALADQVLEQLPSLPHRDVIRRMLVSVLKMAPDQSRADLKLTASTLEEMEHAFNVLERYARRRKVSIFGSARTPPGTPVYEQAREFSEEIARRGFMVITGAGPGVMQAGNQGAGRECSFGMNISLPFEQESNEFIRGDEKDIGFRYFFTRKLCFLKDCHAVVLCPGGFGTHDEGFETLTLVQTGKAQLMPIVLLEPPGFGTWTGFADYVGRHLLDKGMISEPDLSLFRVTNSVTEACDEIERFYRRYHSMRYLEGELAIRLSEPLSAEELDVLNSEFSDLLVEGAIRAGEAREEEWRADPETARLPRLRLLFNRAAHGRLRQMIDRLNGFDPSRILPETMPERGEAGRMPVDAEPGELA